MLEWTAPCVLNPSKGENFAFEKNLLESILDFFFRSTRTRSPSAPFRSLALDLRPKILAGFSLRSFTRSERGICCLLSSQRGNHPSSPAKSGQELLGKEEMVRRDLASRFRRGDNLSEAGPES